MLTIIPNIISIANPAIHAWLFLVMIQEYTNLYFKLILNKFHAVIKIFHFIYLCGFNTIQPCMDMFLYRITGNFNIY